MASEIVIRSALPEDEPAMRALTRDVWDGMDYVPHVWDRWLRDPSGWLMVATVDERLVGLQHIDRQPDGAAWVEGIRVDPELRDRGIGGMMLDRAIRWASDHHCPWLRLATSSGNGASNRVAARAGLELLGTFASVEATPDHDSVTLARLAPSGDFDRIWAFLRQSLDEDAGACVYTEGWTAYSLTPERLRLLLAMGSVVISGESPDAVAIATMIVARPSLRLGLLRGSPEGMERICRWLRSGAARAGVVVVRANVEARDDALAALTTTGFHSRHGNAMFLHGLDLRRSASAQGIDPRP